MTPETWIGTALVGIVVIFLISAFFLMGRMSSEQFTIVRFLAALCGGGAGGIFTGQALFQWESHPGPGETIFYSASGGLALFGLVWLTFPKLPPPLELTDHINISLPALSFRQAAREVGKTVRRNVAFDAKFSKAQLSLKLPGIEINAANIPDAMEQIRVQSTQLPQFTVELKSNIIYLRI